MNSFLLYTEKTDVVVSNQLIASAKLKDKCSRFEYYYLDKKYLKMGGRISIESYIALNDAHIFRRGSIPVFKYIDNLSMEYMGMTDDFIDT